MDCLRLIMVGSLAMIGVALPSGCESCSFTFGARDVRALVHLPAGYEDAAILLDGVGGVSVVTAPGIIEFSASVGAESDGPRKCVYPSGTIEVTHTRCETQRIEFDELSTDAEPRGEAFETEIFMECEPSGEAGRPGWWCASDKDCGDDGFTCHADADVCVPPSCASQADCGDERVLTCDTAAGTCVPV